MLWYSEHHSNLFCRPRFVTVCGGVGFSVDPQQRFLYISDLSNNCVWFLNREDGKVVGKLGSMGQNGGEFFGLHMIAVDSKGNIYTGEVFNGERVQRFVPVK